MSHPYDVKTHGRYGYSAIHDRADYSWPEGKRLAVYLVAHFLDGR